MSRSRAGQEGTVRRSRWCLLTRVLSGRLLGVLILVGAGLACGDEGVADAEEPGALVGQTCSSDAECGVASVCRKSLCVAIPQSCQAPLFEVDGEFYNQAVCDWGGTCIDLSATERTCLCRAAAECGVGYACMRGPGCLCMCQWQGTAPESGCEDPSCASVQ